MLHNLNGEDTENEYDYDNGTNTAIKMITGGRVIYTLGYVWRAPTEEKLDICWVTSAMHDVDLSHGLQLPQF